MENRDSAHSREIKVGSGDKGMKKVATKGVVQLFNAIHTHQSQSKEKGVKDDLKEAKDVREGEIKSSKSSFLDMLKGKKKV